jgi:threonine dehydratase
VFCCVGGGGLIAGVAAYIKRLRPETKIIGVEAVDADAMTQSLAAGKRVTLEQVGLFADGAAVKEVGSETFRLCQQYVDEMITVDNDAICAAIKDVFEDTRSILEPAGALAVAGAKEYVKRHKLRDKTWWPSHRAPT